VIPLAVAVGIENESGPTLRLRGIASLLKPLPVQPAHDSAESAAAEPQSIVGVPRELEMMGVETCVDQSELFGFWIIHRRLAPRTFERKQLRRGNVGPFFAKGRIAWRADPGCKPDPPHFVE